MRVVINNSWVIAGPIAILAFLRLRACVQNFWRPKLIRLFRTVSACGMHLYYQSTCNHRVNPALSQSQQQKCMCDSFSLYTHFLIVLSIQDTHQIVFWICPPIHRKSLLGTCCDKMLTNLIVDFHPWACPIIGSGRWYHKCIVLQIEEHPYIFI